MNEEKEFDAAFRHHLNRLFSGIASYVELFDYVEPVPAISVSDFMRSSFSGSAGVIETLSSANIELSMNILFEFLSDKVNQSLLATHAGQMLVGVCCFLARKIIEGFDGDPSFLSHWMSILVTAASECQTKAVHKHVGRFLCAAELKKPHFFEFFIVELSQRQNIFHGLKSLYRELAADFEMCIRMLTVFFNYLTDSLGSFSSDLQDCLLSVIQNGILNDVVGFNKFFTGSVDCSLVELILAEIRRYPNLSLLSMTLSLFLPSSFDCKSIESDIINMIECLSDDGMNPRVNLKFLSLYFNVACKTKCKKLLDAIPIQHLMPFLKHGQNTILKASGMAISTFFVQFPLLVMEMEPAFSEDIGAILGNLVVNGNGQIFCQFLAKASKMSFFGEKETLWIELLTKYLDKPHNITNDALENLALCFKNYPGLLMGCVRRGLAKPVFNSKRILSIPEYYKALLSMLELASGQWTMAETLQLIHNLTVDVTDCFATCFWDGSFFSFKVCDLVISFSHFLQVLARGERAATLKGAVLTDTLSCFETCACLLLVSPFRSTCMKAVEVISNIIECLHLLHVNDSRIPIDAYSALVANCKTSSYLMIHPTITSAFKMIRVPSPGITKAWDAILEYCLIALHTIMPQQKWPGSRKVTVNKPKELLHDELTQCFAFLLTKPTFESPLVLTIIKSFLFDASFFGRLAVDCVSSALAPQNYPMFMSLVSDWIEEIRTPMGVFSVDERNTAFIYDVLVIARNLLKQQSASDGHVDTKTACKILDNCARYCNLLPIGEIHEVCASYAVYVVHGYTSAFSVDDRIDLANILCGWLVDNAHTRLCNIIIDAMAQILDGIQITRDDEVSMYLQVVLKLLERVPKCATTATQLITSLLKMNVKKGLSQSATCAVRSNPAVRTALMNALSEAIVSRSDNVATNVELKLSDVLFTPGFPVIELVAEVVPFSKCESCARTIMKMALANNLECELLDFVVQREVKNTPPESKNALFRGNAFGAKFVGCFPKFFGSEWLKETLHPVFSKMIQESEEGKDFDLSTSPENFRAFLEEVVARLETRLMCLPKVLVKAVQIVEARVKEVYPDIALEIAYGFLFLRFLVVAFSATANAGLSEMLPDPQRKYLLSASVFMMTAALKRDIALKGKQYEPFRDQCQNAGDRFYAVMQQILHMQITKDELEKVDVEDEESLARELLSDITEPLRAKISEFPENSQARNSAQSLLSFVKGVPLVRDNEDTTSLYKKSGEVSIIRQIMNTEYLESDLQQAGKCFVVDENALYVVCCELTKLQNKDAFTFLLLKTMKEMPNDMCLLVDFSSFVESAFPSASRLLTVWSQCNSAFLNKVKHVFLINVEFPVAALLAKYEDIIQSPKISIAANLKSVLSEIGKPNLKISPLGMESLTPPECVYLGLVNNTRQLVRIHAKSLQFVQEVRKYTSQKVIPYSSVKSLSSLSEGTTFTFFAAKQNKYTITMDKGSNMYSSLTAAIQRYTGTKTGMTNLAVGEKSDQWVLILIGLMNLLCHGTRDTTVAAFRLLGSIYSTYDFAKSLNLLPVIDTNTIPDDCQQIARSIASDLAKMNQNDTVTFVNFWINLTNSFSTGNMAEVLTLIEPWMANILELPDAAKSDIENKLLWKNIQFPGLQARFDEYVWRHVANSDATVNRLLTCLRDLQNPGRFAIFMCLAQRNPKIASQFLSDAPWRANDVNFDFYVDCTNIMLSLSLLEQDFAVRILFQILSFRDVIPRGKYTKMRLMMTKLLEIVKSKNPERICTKALPRAKPKTFEKWAMAMLKLAKLIAEDTEGGGVKDILRELCRHTVSEGVGVARSTSAILACCLSEGVQDELAVALINAFKFKNYDNSIILCVCLSALHLSPELATNLLLVGVCLAATYGTRSTGLFVKSLLDQASVELPSLVPLGPLTGLPFEWNQSLALSVLMYLLPRTDPRDFKVIGDDRLVRFVNGDKSVDFEDTEWPYVVLVLGHLFIERPEMLELLKIAWQRCPRAFESNMILDVMKETHFKGDLQFLLDVAKHPYDSDNSVLPEKLARSVKDPPNLIDETIATAFVAAVLRDLLE